jgi:hypothetical protein
VHECQRKEIRVTFLFLHRLLKLNPGILNVEIASNILKYEDNIKVELDVIG